MKACHCLDIGVHGVASGMYPIGIEWLELTVEKIKKGDDSVDFEFAKNWLEIAIAKVTPALSVFGMNCNNNNELNQHDEKWEPGLLEYSSGGSQFFEKPLKTMMTGEDRKWQKQKICEEKENLPNVLSK